MISKARVKFIKSLQLKKYRKEEQSFMVEGSKGIVELLNSDFEVVWLAGTQDFFLECEPLLKKRTIEVVETNEKELSAIGSFQTNNSALAIAKLRPNTPPHLTSGFALVLDDIRDPGNLGTIIRTADWYGISTIIASHETADFYNPKVINSTMGSFCRVRIFYTQLTEYLMGTSWPIYGATLNGRSIHEMSFEKNGLIVIGNESQGISSSVLNRINQQITIPRIGKAESLNASVATAIILDNVFRSKK
jgi:RNA methyltransferase, TrmH family